jgi:hypothetical protein
MARAGVAGPYLGRIGWQVLGLPLLVAIVLAATMSGASADCAPQAGNNVTATCVGITTNQGSGAPGTSAGSSGYGSGTETGVTVNVSNGASVTGTNYGIDLGSVTVNNGTGATISGSGVGIFAETGAATVVNSGTVSGAVGGDAINAHTTATVTNNSGASIA